MKVLLIHGLARTSLSLRGLDQSLKRTGFTPEHFGYFAFAEPFDRIVARLIRRLQTLKSPYAVVAHSLGGLLIRAALGQAQQDPEHRDPEHIVMLGTPNQQPRLALYAWRALPFRWFTGQCGFNLTCPEFFETLPKVRSPYTLIAGTAGPRGAWSPFGDEINDGIVALSETWLDSTDKLQICGSRRCIQLPVWHTFMMNNPAVQAAVVQALLASDSQA